MSNTDTPFVYSDNVIEFVTVAVQTCIMLEHSQEQDKNTFLEQLIQVLPLLYFKTRILKRPEQEIDGYNELYVAEEDYISVMNGIQHHLSEEDTYIKAYADKGRYTGETMSGSISEDIADIYQELKNMAGNYQTQFEDIMESAVLTCLEAFYEHWGEKLLNAMRALHLLLEANRWEEI